MLNELWEQQKLHKYQDTPVSSSLLCEPRKKLPKEIFINLNKAVLLKKNKAMLLETWRRYRVFAANGSKVNLSHELLLDAYNEVNFLNQNWR